MVILDKQRIYTNEDIAAIENKQLADILACRTPEAVESSITYARFLSKTGLTNENYPLFIKVLEIGNHWVIDALVGDRDPFLFLSSIQPNAKIAEAMFALLAERHPGGIYPKTLSVILGVIQALYNSPEDGYNIFPLTVSDLNALGKHLDKEKGQEDSLNRVILDVLDKISQLEGLHPELRKMEEVAIHASDIRNHFFADVKQMVDVIPKVLLVRMNYQDFEVAPREEQEFTEETQESAGGAGGGSASEAGTGGETSSGAGTEQQSSGASGFEGREEASTRAPREEDTAESAETEQPEAEEQQSAEEESSAEGTDEASGETEADEDEEAFPEEDEDEEQ